MSRPSIDEYMLNIAHQVASRTTCSRRAVGAVITDYYNHILSTGYNGVPKGQTHCIDSPCEGVEFPSGYGLDICRAQHAEVNAIVHCRDLQSATTIYVTVSPCVSCMKMIAATNIRKIVTNELYSKEALDYWTSMGGALIQIK